MQAKSILVGCLILMTAFVLSTIGRIEYLNVVGGHVLPRHTVYGESRTWEIAEFSDVRGQLDDRFLERREHAARIDAKEKGESVPTIPVSGPPYSVSEQRAIEKLVMQHDALTKLHWNLRYLGSTLYFVSPAVLILAIACGLSFKGWGTKVLSFLCFTLTCVGVFVMLVKEYWNALSS